MQIWVDADACPNVVKDILFKAAQRTQLTLTLVANQNINKPNSPFIKMLQVSSGFDNADDEIVERSTEGDLAITADIPLAAELIAKQVKVISPRGEIFTKDNIRARLNMRDFLETMRSSGIQSGGPPALTQADRKKFADSLDRVLQKSLNA